MSPLVSKARSASAVTAPGLLVLLVVLLGNNWGLQYAAAKLAAHENVAPIGSLYATHLVLLGVFFIVTLIWRISFRPLLKHIGFFAAVSAFNNVGQLGSELIAAQHVSAGELSLINSLIPLITILIVIAFRTEKVSKAKIMAVLFGFAAAILIILPNAFAEDIAGFGWTSFAFLSPLTGAIGGVVMARFWPSDLNPLQVAFGCLVCGTLWLTPIAAISGEGAALSVNMDMETVAVVIFLATVGAEFYLFALLTRLGGAVFASCSDFIAICAGLFWGFVFFTEIPTLWMIAAASLSFIALKIAADRTSAEYQAVALSN
jgi:drug/metabolite transporter (DMT)-like permease